MNPFLSSPLLSFKEWFSNRRPGSPRSEKLNSMNLLMYMAPIAVVVLLPATLALEDNVLGITIEKAGREGPGIIFLLFLNSGMAYFVNLTNFLVTKHTSALTLQVRFERRFCQSLLGFPSVLSLT
jgi:hypothetical protein